MSTLKDSFTVIAELYPPWESLSEESKNMWRKVVCAVLSINPASGMFAVEIDARAKRAYEAFANA